MRLKCASWTLPELRGRSVPNEAATSAATLLMQKREQVFPQNTPFSSCFFVIGLKALTFRLVQVSPTAANLKLGNVKAFTPQTRNCGATWPPVRGKRTYRW